MKIILLIIAVLIILNESNSYGQPITWQKVMNNQFGSFQKSQQCSDGGYIACGSDRIYPQNITKIYVVKFNSYGDTIWQKLYDMNINEYYNGYWIEESSDKGFIIGGETYPDDGYLLRIDSIGNIKWFKIISGYNIQQIYCVKQAPDNGYIIALRTIQYGTNDIRVIRTDSLGNTIWDNTIINNNSAEFAEEIQILNSGFLIVGGIILGQTSAVAMLIKFNYQGDTLWTKYYGGNNASGYSSIDKTFDNNFIICGGSTSFNPQNYGESYIVKVDTNGALLWQRTYNTFFKESASSIRTVANKGYVFSGMSDDGHISPQRAFIRLIDTSGNLINEVFYQPGNESNLFYSIETTSDNGFLASGVAVYSGQNPKAYIVKTDSLGNSPIGINIKNINVPNTVELYQNYPNPFNSSTIIKFNISKSGLTHIKIFDVLGEEIAEIFNNRLKTGEYEIQFDAQLYDLASGIYFYSLIFENTKELTQITKKLIYLK